MSSELENWKLYILMALMLFFGATNTVIHKLQNEILTEIDGEEVKYNHPFFQAWCMFIAESWCLVVYYIFDFYTNRKYGGRDNNPEIIEARQKGLNTEMNVALIAIPATFDITGSSLMFFALTLLAASIYQMMRGCLVFIIAIMSVIFLKRVLFRHHWSSLAVIFVGLALVGASPLIYPTKGSSGDDSGAMTVIAGIVLVIVAQFFTGCHMITEEKLFHNYYLHPLKLVGWEGLWGVLIYSCLLLIFQFIKWGNVNICPHGSLENVPEALREWGQNSALWITTIFYIISVASFNCLGVTITKYASAAQRSTIDMSRTAVVWVFFLLYQGKGNEHFIWLELVGFILLICGTLVYNEMVVIPFFGFNQNTKKALQARDPYSDSHIQPLVDSDTESEKDGPPNTKLGQTSS